MTLESRSDASEIGLLHRVIASTRRLLRATWTATGLGITVGLGLLLLVVVSLADIALSFREWLRLTGLLFVAVPSVWAFVNGVLRPLVRRMSSRFVARRIEATLPGIHNRLVSVVDLDADKQNRFSIAFVRRLIAESIERVKHFRPSAVVDQPALKRSALFALIGTLVFATALGIFSDRLPTALARIFSPFADIPPATGVFLDVQPGTTKVLRGEPVDFRAQVSGKNVDRLRLEMKPVEGEHVGKTLWHELRPNADKTRWEFRLPAYDNSFEYRVHGGGTWTRLATVTMLERPRLVGLQAAVHYPSYMLMPEPRVNPPDVADVSGPVGSHVEVTVSVEGDAAIGEIQLLREEFRNIAVEDRPLRVWFENQLPKGHAVEGRWDWGPKERDLNPNAAPPQRLAESTTWAKWHSHPAAPGLSYHLFHSAATSFEVQVGDVLFAEVFVEADQPAEELMLQFYDGQNWDRRAFWGADKINVGQIETASRRQMGELPKTGEWVRLEIPARELELEGHSIRGVNFTQFSGNCLWGRIGTLPAATREVREFVIAETFPLKLQADDTTEHSKSTIAESKHFAAIREGHRWTGTFPINGDGWYRVELKNEIGAANLPMREARISSVPDNPPQIMIERPGLDLVLSEPVKVPIVIAAFDDFGLGELVLSVERGEGGFVGRPVKSYSGVQRADTSLVMLDLAGEGLKNGDVLKYRAEVRDRKGQSAQTQDYQIRIVSNDPNAADKQLAQLEKKEEEFAKKLDKLIEDQAQVQEKLEKLAEKSEPLTEKIEAAQESAEKAATDAAEKAEQAAQEQAQKADPQAKDLPKDQPKTKSESAAKDPSKPQEPTKSAAQPAEPKLDSAAQKELAQLKQELAEVQKVEAQNAEVAKQFNEELKDLAKEAEKQQLLPPELQREMAALSEAFDEAAAQPIKKLAEEIKRSADAKTQDPKVNQLEARADQVQKNLESLKNRLDSLRDAQKDAKMDAEMALDELHREMLKQSGELTAAELEELRKAIEALREKLQNLANEESELLEFTPKAPESLLPEIANKQRDVERRADKELAKTKELQKRDDYKALKQKAQKQKPQSGEPTTPMDDPLAGDNAPEKAATADDFSNIPPMPDAAKPDANGDEFQPAIADPASKKPSKTPAPKTQKPKPGNDKSQPASSKDKPGAGEQREMLADREAKTLDQLQKADESLAADQRALDELLKDIGELLNSEMGESGDGEPPMPGSAKSPEQPQSPAGGDPKNAPGEAGADAEQAPLSAEKAAELSQLLQSAKAQKAMQMAARLQAMQAGDASDQPNKGSKNPNAPPPPLKSNPKPRSGLEGDNSSQFAMEAALKELDPATRALILKMQPRVREELLQSLREEGPEGYQRFIRDYFKRLTKAGQSNK